jgi:hypothetical protein
MPDLRASAGSSVEPQLRRFYLTICYKEITNERSVIAHLHMKGAGVIWNGDPLEPPVIPAKAGIQSAVSTFAKACGVDSRFRGND